MFAQVSVFPRLTQPSYSPVSLPHLASDGAQLEQALFLKAQGLVRLVRLVILQLGSWVIFLSCSRRFALSWESVWSERLQASASQGLLLTPELLSAMLMRLCEWQ